MRRILTVVIGCALVVLPVRLGAWGMDVHKMITGRALDGMPGDLKAFLGAKKDFIVEHSVDPDLWRYVGAKGTLGDEDPNHFLDIDGLDDPPPFAHVPHDWTAFVAKYGIEGADKAGHLPWRAEEIFGRLVAAFQSIGRTGSYIDSEKVRYLVAIMAHYVEDADVPFHASANYDGQLTGQRGIHSRFETEVIRRNLPRLTLAPVQVRPIADIREFIFATLTTSQADVAPVLDADRRAAADYPGYDPAYFDALFAAVHPIIDARLSDAASGVASVVAAAYEKAGRPKLPPGAPAQMAGNAGGILAPRDSR